MTGKELIKWILNNNAEDLPVVIQYRDSGGLYSGGEYLDEPALGVCSKNTDDYIWRIHCTEENADALIL